MAGLGSVVWVVGSGFSRHVGGPLLDELLSEKGGSLVRARHPVHHDMFQDVRRLFGAHHKVSPRRESHQLWSNAEEFLDFLDLARTDAGLAKVAGVDSNPQKLWKDAVNAVAAECSFANNANLGFEAWAPYKVWQEELKPPDAIVTFNYDLVTERLGLTSLLPTEYVDQRRVNVFKLHGSVDWFLSGDKVQRTAVDGEPPLIATPGPTKLKSTQENGPLGTLWNQARFALTKADAIVFMGYRFPPSDSYALTSILGAIRENEEPRVLSVHTVLGPKVHGEDSLRLTRLLKQALATGKRSHLGTGELRASNLLIGLKTGDKNFFDVTEHPLYAQDFMALVPRSQLLFSR